jgi:hypothetical protein
MPLAADIEMLSIVVPAAEGCSPLAEGSKAGKFL